MWTVSVCVHLCTTSCTALGTVESDSAIASSKPCVKMISITAHAEWATLSLPHSLAQFGYLVSNHLQTTLLALSHLFILHLQL